MEKNLAKDLMIGDWVYSDCVVTQVTLVNDDGEILTHENPFLPNEDIKPIPLTPEILKANGFRESIEEGTYYFPEGCKAHERGYAIENEEGLWFITEHNLMTFAWVHELQHALRLCNLNELAENFKIE